jgi:hypothetical protein
MARLLLAEHLALEALSGSSLPKASFHDGSVRLTTHHAKRWVKLWMDVPNCLEILAGQGYLAEAVSFVLLAFMRSTGVFFCNTHICTLMQKSVPRQ